MNGMMFGGEGPIMTGTWYNPNTGDAFTVRDSFFEDNQYVVTTTDGRYLYYNQLQNYIQTDMKLEDLKKMKSENTTTKKTELPPEVASLIEENGGDPYASMLTNEDLLIGNNTPQLGNLYNDNNILARTQRPFDTVKEKTVMQTPSPTTMNEAIIEKALKNAPKPEITVDVAWDVFPEKQIEMLKDVMEIPEDEIIMWYLDNIDMMELVDALKTAIRYRILCKEGKAITGKIDDFMDSYKDNCVDPSICAEVPTIVTDIEAKSAPKKSRKKKVE